MSDRAREGKGFGESLGRARRRNARHIVHYRDGYYRSNGRWYRDGRYWSEPACVIHYYRGDCDDDDDD